MTKATSTHPAVQEYLQQMRSNGGKQRAKNLTPAQLRQIALKGTRARWGHNKNSRIVTVAGWLRDDPNLSLLDIVKKFEDGQGVEVTTVTAWRYRKAARKILRAGGRKR